MIRNLLFLLFFVPMALKAQQVALYPSMCDDLQRVFCDYVTADGETRYISSRHGQYVGNLIDNTIYGWGYYLADNGSQTYGQFRNGKHFFGITMTEDYVRVGSSEHYVEYNLVTGKIMRIHTVDGDIKLQEPYLSTDGAPSPYSFEKMTYSNGDAYYGETCNGKRHGYGVYYWSNGDFWYGEYRDGYRQGYGALFKVNHKVFYGKWIGDCKVE